MQKRESTWFRFKRTVNIEGADSEDRTPGLFPPHNLVVLSATWLYFSAQRSLQQYEFVFVSPQKKKEEGSAAGSVFSSDCCSDSINASWSSASLSIPNPALSSSPPALQPSSPPLQAQP